ncbi:MAG: energy transducer TonB [Pseudomonadota bacterium]
MICCTLLCLLTGIPAAAIASGDREFQTLSIPPHTELQPKHIERPIYPRGAAINGHEGWARIEFTVDREGKVESPELYSIAGDSHYHGDMGEAALRALKKWTFEPASVEGEHVEQRATQTITFTLDGSAFSITKGFEAGAETAMAYLSASDFGAAGEALEPLRGKSLKNLRELALLDLMESAYWVGMGDDRLALEHAARADVTLSTHGYEDLYRMLLRVRIPIQMNQLRLRAALADYEELLTLEPALSEEDPLHTYADRMRTVLASEDALVSEGQILRCELCESRTRRYGRPLNHKRFYLEAEEGTIDSMMLACGTARLKVDWVESAGWELDTDHDGCSVTFFGRNKSLIRLVELPG